MVGMRGDVMVCVCVARVGWGSCGRDAIKMGWGCGGVNVGRGKYGVSVPSGVKRSEVSSYTTAAESGAATAGLDETV